MVQYISVNRGEFMAIDKNNEHDKYAGYTTRELFNKYRSGNIEARDAIFKRYKHYVYDIVEKYKDFGLEEEDLLQSGYEGLIYAIEESAKTNPTIFLQKIERQIHRTIRNAIIDNLGMNYFALAKSKIFKLIKLIKDINELERIYLQALGRKPTLEEIKYKLISDEITEEDIDEALLNMELISSVDSRLHEFSNGYRFTSVTRPTEDEVIIKELWSELEKVKCLDSRRLEVLKRRHVLGELLEEIAIDMDVHSERVRQLEFNSYARLRYKAKYLKGYLEEIRDYNASKDATYSLKPRTKSN